VLELLDAGISVYTTMNVQHVESLNDIVAKITGGIVRETVPDSCSSAPTRSSWWISAHELLQRLQEGKVYLPEQAQAAIQNFFRKGTLMALRELALRRHRRARGREMQATCATTPWRGPGP
jgi:two-component system sensor histidine kinase KdpD